jgi:hypothetical protein
LNPDAKDDIHHLVGGADGNAESQAENGRFEGEDAFEVGKDVVL